ncbi:unnamed protein product [Polarella glacialis]|uniref:Uncharacterized protein n=1 Tax=Polarella glacialis TaxID=89957 RepID=A0A813LER9_POLGL|nr:unnamed protein product [Polarella glacialis]
MSYMHLLKYMFLCAPTVWVANGWLGPTHGGREAQGDHDGARQEHRDAAKPAGAGQEHGRQPHELDRDVEVPKWRDALAASVCAGGDAELRRCVHEERPECDGLKHPPLNCLVLWPHVIINKLADWKPVCSETDFAAAPITFGATIR